jgi:16S rRNA (cytosine1402-N4)-methyltransferase
VTTPAAPRHVPVLPAAVLEWLNPQPGQTVVDCTLGGGGHARLIATKLGPGGRLIGLDRDATMIELARPGLESLPDRPNLTLVHSNFDDLRGVLDGLGVGRVDGVLADLGFSSDQMDDPARGLSFSREGPLDMRLSLDDYTTAEDLLNQASERDLADYFWKYGEERFSRRIARQIVQTRKARPLRTTDDLAALVRRCVPRGKGGIDPATRVFQALRIAVNDELGALDQLLEALPDCVTPGGRAIVISFHSLEDRRVKQAFRQGEVWTVLTRKPVTASDEEVAANPRARSAKLRAAERVGERATRTAGTP